MSVNGVRWSGTKHQEVGYPHLEMKPLHQSASPAPALLKFEARHDRSARQQLRMNPPAGSHARAGHPTHPSFPLPSILEDGIVTNSCVRNDMSRDNGKSLLRRHRRTAHLLVQKREHLAVPCKQAHLQVVNTDHQSSKPYKGGSSLEG